MHCSQETHNLEWETEWELQRIGTNIILEIWTNYIMSTEDIAMLWLVFIVFLLKQKTNRDSNSWWTLERAAEFVTRANGKLKHC